MAFYFALLNVSKKDDHRQLSSSSASRRHHYHHRRHSIASVESPHTTCRELPRPQLLDEEDLIISNNSALESSQRSRGGTRASKWIHENQQTEKHLTRSHRITQFPISNSAGEFRSKKVEKQSGDVRRLLPSRLPVRKKDPAEGNPVRPICRIHVERALNITRQISNIPATSGSATATDDSRRSSQMSNASASPQRNPSLTSSTGDEPCTSRVVSATKISGVSLASRNSEPRLKKVTFESSPYVISNTFLGDRAVLVRRGSGTAVHRLPISSDEPSLRPTPKVLAPRDEVCGDDWWTPFGDLPSADNRANEGLERLQSKAKFRRLIRRRSTSDSSRIVAYRNTGFLSSSQERKPSRESSNSRMTVSVDRPKYY